MKPKTLSNLEIVVLALYVLGGEGGPVSTEDVAVKVNEFAPGRLAWKKYHRPDQLGACSRVRVPDRCKEGEYGRLVGGGNTTGWVLSDAPRTRTSPFAGVSRVGWLAKAYAQSG